jgi:hypothetical protein
VNADSDGACCRAGHIVESSMNSLQAYDGDCTGQTVKLRGIGHAADEAIARACIPRRLASASPLGTHRYALAVGIEADGCYRA